MGHAMRNDSPRSDYGDGGRRRRLDSREWLVAAALALVVVAAAIDGSGGNAGWLYIVAAVLAISGLVGLADRS